MTKSIKRIALVVGLGTVLSKTGGMARQLVIASAFGIGTAYDAFNYAYILPGFFLVLLGGINGPFHNTMVATLSNKNKTESSKIFASINTTICSILFLVSIFLFIAADPIIKIVGPGLSLEMHEVAVIQLQIMSPIAFLSGLIGLGFGALNSKNEFLIPSISPVFSSITIIFAISIFWIIKEDSISFFDQGLNGAILISTSTLIGALFQYIVQIPSLIRKELFKFNFSFKFKDPGFKKAWKIIAPATLSSGMLQINVFTDLLFASEMIGAAAALTYANFLIQAPLGLVSNTLLIPLLPRIAILQEEEDKKKLIKLIKKSLIFSSLSMFSLAAIFISVGQPIIQLFYGRGAFDSNAIDFVVNLLIAYSIGMPLYLCRDLLVRIFYGLGNSSIPFRVSSIGIILNLIFDWLFVGGPSPWGELSNLNLGASGLVYATVIVNLISSIMLTVKLNHKLKKLPIFQILNQNIKILFSSFIAGLFSWIISLGITWPYGVVGLLGQIIVSSLVCLFVFCLACKLLKIIEVNEIINILRKKIIRH